MCLLGAPSCARQCYAKFHSLHSPELGIAVPNQDITGYMSMLNNVGLCCDILNKTELFVSRAGTSVTELYCSTASKCQSQNRLESQARRKKIVPSSISYLSCTAEISTFYISAPSISNLLPLPKDIYFMGQEPKG